jgi:hypothetical protein
MLVPFVTAGLRSGNKCLCAPAEPDADALVAEVDTHVDFADLGGHDLADAWFNLQLATQAWATIQALQQP